MESQIPTQQDLTSYDNTQEAEGWFPPLTCLKEHAVSTFLGPNVHAHGISI
ncbi:hypothetical protein DPMN_190025 [Dreissena polymorpha]|uniref:Uncharacterized protein n=1 Tax=Dreissena polymorpha TaxID=45954 RepID=A0A9D4IBK4_DREPO|nr:hypothetical protein DPMN_189941 [Dreissena polymorpha]KAH3755334.1 hypothetical protein DPMN_190025 [Dreissena polymorpha]